MNKGDYALPYTLPNDMYNPYCQLLDTRLASNSGRVAHIRESIKAVYIVDYEEQTTADSVDGNIHLATPIPGYFASLQSSGAEATPHQIKCGEWSLG